MVQIFVNAFFDWIRQQAQVLSRNKQENRELIISDKERKHLYNTMRQCCVCYEEILKDCVVHLDHATRKNFVWAHSKCNLRQKHSFTQLFFHNLGKYNSHHLIRIMELNTDGWQL